MNSLVEVFILDTDIEAPKILTIPGQNRLVIAGASMSSGVGNGSLKVDDEDKGIPVGQKQGVAVLNHKPTKVLRLSTSNPEAPHKPDMQSLQQKLVAG